MTIFDFQAAHDAIHGPEPEHVVEIDGEKWFRFVCLYDHDGAEFSFDIWAPDIRAAETFLASIKKNGRLGGQIYDGDA